MTDTTLPPGDEAGDRIEPVDIQQEMQRSYIDYAMSVIVGRALPEVRDGLKPVHRRVLYAMYDSGFRPDRSHAKSARSVAETMGNYHPHGDASIYDTLVRMAQPWSLRYPLVDGQGNFGSPGNDPPAAMRYCTRRCGGELPDSRPDPRRGPGARRIPTIPSSSKCWRHGIVADRLFHSGDHETYTGQGSSHRHGEPSAAVFGRRGVPPAWNRGDRPGDYASARESTTMNRANSVIPAVGESAHGDDPMRRSPRPHRPLLLLRVAS